MIKKLIKLLNNTIENMTNTINVNWVSYSWSWDLVIKNNKVYINWKLVDTKDHKQILIKVEWDIDKINCDVCESITVEWNIKNNIQTTSWDIYCKNVWWYIKTTSWDIECWDTEWSVNTTSWDINAKQINWSCNTLSWDITRN